MSTEAQHGFDRVVELARSIAREAGSDYDAKGSRRAHWRAKAEAQLALPALSGTFTRYHMTAAFWMGVLASSGLYALLVSVLP